ncbi:MAG: putative glycoside hydrolase [Niabella sp.]
MKLLGNIVFIIFFVLTGFAGNAQRTGSSALTNIPQDGLPLAQIFDSRIKDPAVYLEQANKVFFVWGATVPGKISSIVTSKYFPSYRNPDRHLDIEWYKKNHPDWIMYKGDRVTPAYGYIYDYGGLVPLDVSNPEVRNFYLKEFILPAIQQGFKMVAMDNADLGNWPGAVGHFKNGTWVPLYTGKKNDKAFQDNMIGWMHFLAEGLHSLGVKVAANIKANSASPEIVLRMMHTVDIWLDENGFTHTGKNITGKTWQRQFDYLKEIAPVKGYVSINQVGGTVEQADAAQIEWVIANFLLTRGPQSLLAITGFEQKAICQEFHYRPEMDVNIGAPVEKPHQQQSVWVRHYQKGLVYVNPSAVDTATLILPKGKWKTISGVIKQGKLSLIPGSGVVLIKI